MLVSEPRAQVGIYATEYLLLNAMCQGGAWNHCIFAAEKQRRAKSRCSKQSTDGHGENQGFFVMLLMLQDEGPQEFL